MRKGKVLYTQPQLKFSEPLPPDPPSRERPHAVLIQRLELLARMFYRKPVGKLDAQDKIRLAVVSELCYVVGHSQWYDFERQPLADTLEELIGKSRQPVLRHELIQARLPLFPQT
ncbi:MAG: hypothetical protein KW802_04645 [Candidatus Doudnabacteria bacterium]|nr:hypothetical protein [Candidatus Doudnabacteria bacterium]